MEVKRIVKSNCQDYFDDLGEVITEIREGLKNSGKVCSTCLAVLDMLEDIQIGLTVPYVMMTEEQLRQNNDVIGMGDGTLIIDIARADEDVED